MALAQPLAVIFALTFFTLQCLAGDVSTPRCPPLLQSALISLRGEPSRVRQNVTPIGTEWLLAQIQALPVRPPNTRLDMEGFFQFCSSNRGQVRVLLAPVRQWAARQGLIRTPALLDELPPGVYTWILTLEGRLIVGSATHHSEFGVKHFNLAEGLPTIALAGELEWISPSDFSFNLLSGSFMREAYPERPGPESPAMRLATELFQRMGAITPQTTGTRTLIPKRPPTPHEWLDLLSSPEFRREEVRQEIHRFYQEEVVQGLQESEFSEFVEAFRVLYGPP